MLDKLKGLYERLPKEVRVFVEYILPSAIITSLIDYMMSLDIKDIYVSAMVNIVLIFLRQIKPRMERLSSHNNK